MYKSKKSRLFSSHNKFSFPKRSGGSLTDLIVVIIILVLIGAGVMWVIKRTGEAGQEYAEGMVSAHNQASSIVCKSNMGQIYQVIQMYSMTEDAFPETFNDLVNEVGTSRVFECSEPNCPSFEYIPGQSFNSPENNILLYEPAASHDGKCTVLRVGGTVEMLAPEELEAAIRQTKAHLER